MQGLLPPKDTDWMHYALGICCTSCIEATKLLERASDPCERRRRVPGGSHPLATQVFGTLYAHVGTDEDALVTEEPQREHRYQRVCTEVIVRVGKEIRRQADLGDLPRSWTSEHVAVHVAD